MSEWRISKQGLTSCPHCQQHIKVKDIVEAAECPLCQGDLKQALRGTRVRRFRRGALLAAALVSAAVAPAACVSAALYGGPPAEWQPPDAGSPDTTTPTDAGTPDSGNTAD